MQRTGRGIRAEERSSSNRSVLTRCGRKEIRDEGGGSRRRSRVARRYQTAGEVRLCQAAAGRLSITRSARRADGLVWSTMRGRRGSVSADANITLVKQLYDSMSKGDLDAVLE